jgi:hypothetical protein
MTICRHAYTMTISAERSAKCCSAMAGMVEVTNTHVGSHAVPCAKGGLLKSWEVGSQDSEPAPATQMNRFLQRQLHTKKIIRCTQRRDRTSTARKHTDAGVSFTASVCDQK